MGRVVGTPVLFGRQTYKILRSHVGGIDFERAFERLFRLGGHDAVRGGDLGLAKFGFTRRGRAQNAHDIRARTHGVAIAPHLHIDRRHHLPAARVIRPLFQMGLDLRHHAFDRALLGRQIEPGRKRRARQLRRAPLHIEDRRHDRQRDQSDQRRGAPPPQHGLRFGGAFGFGFWSGLFRFGLVGRGQQAARNLESGRFRLGIADQAGFAVALDLFKLVAIDRYILALHGYGTAPGQWPEHGENCRRGHQGKDEPEGHPAALHHGSKRPATANRSRFCGCFALGAAA